MRLDQLGKAFKNEAKKNPKKTALLGLLSLVALYFCGPLVWSWLPGDKSPKSDVAVTPEAVTASVALPLTPTPNIQAMTPTEEETFYWNDLIHAIDRDRHMSTALLPSDFRNPFQPIVNLPKDPLASDGDSTDSPDNKAKPPREYRPEDFNLKLNNIVIGPRFSMATINGKRYRKGTSIIGGAASASTSSGDSSKGNETDTITFTLAEVHPRSVELRRHGKTYTLLLKKPKFANGDQMTFYKSSGEQP